MSEYTFSLDVPESALQSILGASNSAEVTLVDWYEAIIKSLKAERATNAFLLDHEHKKNERLQALFQSTVAASITPAVPQPVQDELQSIKDENAGLKLALDSANAIYAVLKTKIEEMQPVVDAAEDSKATEKACRDELGKVIKRCEKLERLNAVQGHEIKKLKAAAAKDHEIMTAAAKAMQQTKVVNNEIREELYTLRNDARLMSLMCSSFMHEEYGDLTFDEGKVIIMNRRQLVKAADNTINTDRAVGIWLSRHGFASLLTVTKPDENGVVNLVIPGHQHVSPDVQALLAPPKQHFGTIAEILNDIDVVEYEQAYARVARKNELLSIQAAPFENRLQLKKHLIGKKPAVKLHGGRKKNRK